MKVLILTDHRAHAPSNSLYPLVNALRRDNRVSELWIASRADIANAAFFNGMSFQNVHAHKVQNDIHQAEFDEKYRSSNSRVTTSDFDLYLLRLPRPISNEFLTNFKTFIGDKPIVNDPIGINLTSNKKYLLHYQAWTPEIQLCHCIEDVIDMYQRFPIVLKPLMDYGGRGLVKIESEKVITNGITIPFDLWRRKYERFPEPYLAMRFLKNVTQGDKRIIVANGRVMGASLRMPAEGEWLCNVAQGGTSTLGSVTDRELLMIDAITPDLKSKGIFLYGLDTLVDDEGGRVLSEINTLSVGGIHAVQNLSDTPVADQIIEELFKFLNF